jgi:hypothetical protein
MYDAASSIARHVGDGDDGVAAVVGLPFFGGCWRVCVESGVSIGLGIRRPVCLQQQLHN